MNIDLSDKKKVMVMGAGGSIGSAVVEALLAQGVTVVPVFRKDTQRTMELVQTWKIDPGQAHFWDATSEVNMEQMFHAVDRLDGLVYAVGHCPLEGFRWAVSQPLSTMRPELLETALAMHIWGPYHVLRASLSQSPKDVVINPGAKFVFVSSAIGRTTAEGKLPPSFLQAGYYAAAMDGMNTFLRFMRVDPLLLAKKIKLQLLLFGAIDTPFHVDVPLAMRPPALLPMSTVVAEILAALNSDDVIDKMVVATAPERVLQPI